MYVFLIKLVIQIALMLLLAPKPENTSPPQAKVSDFNFPTAEESRNQMLLYGTRQVTGANNFFADGVSQKDIKESVGFIVKSKITIATQYRVSFGMGIAFGGETEIKAIAIENETIWEMDDKTITDKDKTKGIINIPDFYEEDHGIAGPFTFYKGSDTQLPDPHMNTFDEFPSYRGLSYIVFENFYIGNDTNPPVFDFIVKRIPTTGVQALDSNAEIDGNCNPAVVIYDILTDEEYGIGVNKDIIDIDSFVKTAKTLKDEGIGLSITYEDQYECDKFVSEVLKTISGSLTEDYRTGKFKLKLARDDFKIEDLFVFDTSNIISVQSYGRNTQEKLYNEVKVKFSNEEKFYKTDVAQFQNQALVVERPDGNNSFQINYPWITKAEVASKLALRDAIPTTVYMSSMELETARIYGLEIGDAVVVKFNPYSIEQVVFRISEIDYGTFRNNTMRVSLIQDTFGLDLNIYAPPTPPTWNGFDFSAQPCNVNIIETPYFFKKENFGIMTFGESPNGVGLNYQVRTKYDNESDYSNNGGADSFTPLGTTQVDILENSNQVILKGSLEMLRKLKLNQFEEGYNLAIIESSEGQEFITFSDVEYSIADSGYIIKGVERGLIDTVPKKHGKNAKVWFISYGYYINDEYNFKANSLINLKPLTVTSSERLPLAKAIEHSHQFGSTSRNERPPAPVNLKINGRNFWSANVGQDDLSIEYTVRTIKEQERVVKYNESRGTRLDDKPDSIVIKIYDDKNILIKTFNESVSSNLTNTVVFTDEKTINPLGVYYPSLRVEINSVKNGIDSHDKYDINIVRV